MPAAPSTYQTAAAGIRAGWSRCCPPPLPPQSLGLRPSSSLSSVTPLSLFSSLPGRRLPVSPCSPLLPVLFLPPSPEPSVPRSPPLPVSPCPIFFPLFLFTHLLVLLARPISSYFPVSDFPSCRLFRSPSSFSSPSLPPSFSLLLAPSPSPPNSSPPYHVPLHLFPPLLPQGKGPPQVLQVPPCPAGVCFQPFYCRCRLLGGPRTCRNAPGIPRGPVGLPQAPQVHPCPPRPLELSPADPRLLHHKPPAPAARGMAANCDAPVACRCVILRISVHLISFPCFLLSYQAKLSRLSRFVHALDVREMSPWEWMAPHPWNTCAALWRHFKAQGPWRQ